MSLPTGQAAQARAVAAPVRVAGWAMAAGALGVLVTSLFYVLSPRAGAMPVQPFDLAAALAGAAAGAATMKAAGMAGIFGDLIWAVGTFLMAQHTARCGRGLATAGWVVGLLSLAIFTLVDAMVGFVLPQLALMPGAEGAFAGFKRLFDVLFLLGTVAYGFSAVVALGSEARTGGSPVHPVLAAATAVVGGVAVIAGLAGLAGLSVDLLVGASVGVGSALFIAIGLQIALAKSGEASAWSS
ncbi:hypothetical protein LJR130_003515 [Variovorax sp. LjRoot130]|uniref:hypothetical protein n=1 Tax=Variovorax sp. LjRoot130 TaxID=3342261 RepID=UPI003ECE0D03